MKIRLTFIDKEDDGSVYVIPNPSGKLLHTPACNIVYFIQEFLSIIPPNIRVAILEGKRIALVDEWVVLEDNKLDA